MADLLNTPTNKVLRSMAIPTGLGMTATILFQVVDTFFIGTLGNDPLTALGFASTVYFLLMGLYIGLSIGVSIITGISFGEHNLIAVKRKASIGILTAFLLSCLLSTLGILFNDQLFVALGAQEHLLPYISQYMIPLYIGMPLLAATMIAGAVIRTSGNIRPPEVIFAIGGVINLILDYAFIYGKLGLPELGIAGVAYGTSISWAFMFVCTVFIFLKSKYWGFSIKNTKENKTTFKSILRFGFPSIVTQLVNPATIMFVTYLLSRHSIDSVAAYGVAGRIETLFMIGIMAVSTSVTPFIAQNVGAKKYQRIDEAIIFGGTASIYLGVIVMIILFVSIYAIAGLFTDSPLIIGYTALYFFLLAGTYVFFGLYQITAAILNGLQKPFLSLKVMLVKTFVFTFPLVIAGSFHSIEGIFVALALGNLLGGFYARLVMRKVLKEMDSSLVKRSPAHDIMNDLKLMLRLKRS